ncbi:hypothetical protein B0A48_04248 [Cryoendolithus antarcticus]|uniref:M protein repeat protein n=1 Tax=Cryoendolithus antarcticus TaxID=1507870 RepID=A0A1V8TF43_9PEZI|nr:hypothetical protein B0A48_04248 [Cryoendolithus antarcticus]
MADADKEKAEKVAAAKKRYEQIKKQKAKEGKKSTATSSKKDTKATEDVIEDAVEEPSAETAKGDANGDTVADETASLPQQSKQRSESFRLGSQQATRIEELEKENAALKKRAQASDERLVKVEEERDGLAESSGDVATLTSKAKGSDELKVELAAAKRELEQAKKDGAVKGVTRRQSGISPDLAQELERKTSLVDGLELELSSLRNEVNTLKATIGERDASIVDAETQTKAAQSDIATARQELDALKVSLAFPSDDTAAANADPEALSKRITLLESDLRTATANVTSAAERSTSLEQKITALTKLHRDATTASSNKDKELTDLRGQLQRQHRPSHVRDASSFDLQDEETEEGQLQTRIRILEAENFDLKRGVWRDRRAELQPGMHDPDAPEYEDVDLNGPDHHNGRGSFARQTSSFQDVISSGISAFTGRTKGVASPQQNRQRNMSVGLLSEDGFDEEAFRLAQEEEARRRIERVKEVKRGLEGWRRWRVDLSELRTGGAGAGRECGPVFEI